MTNFQTIYLIDDDDALRLAVSITLRRAGHQVRSYVSAEMFLDDISSNATGCVVTDLLLPGFNGIELQQALIKRQIKLPVIIMSGYGDISQSVQAIKAGAVDFLEKPVAPETLLRHIEEALRIDVARHLQDVEQMMLQQRFGKLSPREHEVTALVAAGKTNKEIAQSLAISYRTVEKYRATAMIKLEVENVVALAKLVDRYTPPPHKPVDARPT